MENDLQSQPAVLQMTVEIKRAATGKVDAYTVTGFVPQDDQKPEPDHGSDAQHDLS